MMGERMMRLECPTCWLTTTSPFEDGVDPPGAVLMQFDCPGCALAGQKSEGIIYYDSDGSELAALIRAEEAPTNE